MTCAVKSTASANRAQLKASSFASALPGLNQQERQPRIRSTRLSLIRSYFLEAGLQIDRFVGAGVEENQTLYVIPRVDPRVGRSDDSRQQSASRRRGQCELPDATGWRVLDLKPGPNDVSRLAPGLYYVREEPSAFRYPQGDPDSIGEGPGKSSARSGLRNLETKNHAGRGCWIRAIYTICGKQTWALRNLHLESK